jgi:ubiquinone/menaquinone biosynthesis C-methylase UbiE
LAGRARQLKLKLYNGLSRCYDVLYAWKDYRAEAAKVSRLIAEHSKSGGRELLEVACGTGKHAQYLKRDFSVLATDASTGMLEVARKNVKGVAFRQADMLTLKLGREFDAITCLFSSIAYVKTRANLGKALRNFARHLKPGGVVLIEPWFNRSTYMPHTPHVTTSTDGDLTVARVSVARVRRKVSIVDLSLIIAEKGKAVRLAVDRHELAMFDSPPFLEAMRAAGFRARFRKDGLMKNRGLYIGVKI